MLQRTIRERWVEFAENQDLVFLDERHDNAIEGLVYISNKPVLIYNADQVRHNFQSELIGYLEAQNLVSDLASKTQNPLFIFR